MGGAVQNVVDVAVDVTVGVASGEYLFKGVGTTLEVVGNEVLDDALGLDKVGNEVARVGNQLNQVGKVLGGDYHEDMKKAQDLQNQIDSKISAYNQEVDKLSEHLSSLMAFHEIFQMAASNRLDAYTEKYGPELTALVETLQEQIRSIQNEYDFVIGLTQGAFVQRIVSSVIMIIGGLVSDLKDISSGSADSATWKRAIQSIVTIIIIILLVFAGPAGWAAITVLVLSSIAAFMMLDGMYAHGAATGAIMSCFDFLFNDVLNLDDFVGKDFDNFDKDSDDYQQMVMFTQIALSLTAASINWASMPTSVASDSGNIVNGSKSAVGADSTITASMINNDSTFFGINTSTYSSIYKAFTAANEVNDAVNSKKAYEAMTTKFKEDSAKIESAIISKYSKNMVKHYKDSAYFLQDQQEFIDRYVFSMTAQNMYVDPYGTTPVANIRFTPDKDTRMLNFGYEEIFDENKQAGSANYFKTILYG